MFDLIPSPEAVMKILRDTGAYNYGHFADQKGRHSSHYFQVPMAFHFYNNARLLAVGLSRKFRMDKAVSSQIPKVAIVSPSSDGIPVAFSIREALNAEQLYWVKRENGVRYFPQYMKKLKVNSCIVVDDIMRSGSTVRETIKLIRDLGAEVVGCGAIVKFKNGPTEIDGIEVKSLVEFDSPIYDSLEEWKAVDGNDSPLENILEF